MKACNTGVIWDTGDQCLLKTLKQRREQNTKVKLVRVYIRDGGKLVVRGVELGLYHTHRLFTSIKSDSTHISYV